MSTVIPAAHFKELEFKQDSNKAIATIQHTDWFFERMPTGVCDSEPNGDRLHVGVEELRGELYRRVAVACVGDIFDNALY